MWECVVWHICIHAFCHFMKTSRGIRSTGILYNIKGLIGYRSPSWSQSFEAVPWLKLVVFYYGFVILSWLSHWWEMLNLFHVSFANHLLKNWHQIDDQHNILWHCQFYGKHHRARDTKICNFTFSFRQPPKQDWVQKQTGSNQRTSE